MIRPIAVIGLTAAVSAPPAAAAPAALTTEQLFDICGSSTIGEAEARGGALGWRRMSEAELAEWRAAFVAYHGGSVQVLGWRRGENDGDESLSFWIAQGSDAHQACVYSTGDPGQLLDALTARLGAPAHFDKYEFGTTASWKGGRIEVGFSSVGSKGIVHISPVQ